MKMFFSWGFFGMVSSRNKSLITKTPSVVMTKWVRPIGQSQETYMDALMSSETPMVVATGPAGCGKTLLACDAFVQMYKQGLVSRLVLTRPSVSVDGEDLGFLPGSIENKMAPWTRPVLDILQKYFSLSEWQSLTQQRVIDIIPLAFMRGRTFDHSFILGDEMQNSSPSQWLTLVTRCGNQSKLVLTGDLAQSDLCTSNGLETFLKKHQSRPLSCCKYISLQEDSVCRSPLVKDYLLWMKEP